MQRAVVFVGPQGLPYTILRERESAFFEASDDEIETVLDLAAATVHG